jgi:hypothetical protein
VDASQGLTCKTLATLGGNKATKLDKACAASGVYAFICLGFGIRGTNRFEILPASYRRVRDPKL